MAVVVKPEQAYAYAEILEILDYMEEEYVSKAAEQNMPYAMRKDLKKIKNRINDMKLRMKSEDFTSIENKYDR